MPLPHKLECRNCGTEMKDLTGRIDQESAERILWCWFCGTLCTPNKFDQVGSEDWKMPKMTADYDA